MRKLLSIAIAVGLAGACGPRRTGDQDAGDDGGPCEPGTSEDCYSGASATEDVGPCHGGTRTCDSGGTWGNCEGEVTPAGEVCGNSVDDNCSGMVDEDVDNDGDGFTTCGGDCCDSTNDGCGNPELVNPGAFEAAGNMVDDDCDGIADNAVAGMCDSGLVSNSATGTDYAKAMDICQTTTDAESTWGVIDASFVKADGTGAPNQNQKSIRPGFGGTTVQAGSAFTVLSTGAAAAPNQTAPAHVDFQAANELGATSGFPGDWLAANGNNLPNAPGCPEPIGGTANDPVMLQMRIRTPTNAKSFSFSVNFMSAEYPEWTCSPYNDFFVVLLDSTYTGSPANPTDKNLAFYTSPAMQNYPVGVNLANGDTGLFTICTNGPTGCAQGSTPGNINTCIATNIGELAGTGMDTMNPPPNPLVFGELGFCGSNNRLGGGTGWLTTAGNVVGGEIITLRIAVWDTSDGLYDSVAIIDNFQWSVDSSTPGTVIE